MPSLYAQMRAALVPARVPRVHAETVARQNQGVLELVDQFIAPNLDQRKGAERQRLEAAIAGLKPAVAEQQAWLDNTLVPNARGDFRNGARLYDEKRRYALNSSLSRQEIRQRAKAELARVRGEMYAIAKQVLIGRRNAPALPANPNPAQQQAAIEAALELAYQQHPARNAVVEASRTTWTATRCSAWCN